MPTADSSGSIRRSKVTDGEKSDILIALRQGKSVQEVARMFARDESTIGRIVKEFKPTKALAQAKLEASLATLVDRVVEKATVAEVVDILSRPNIGVLEAPVKPGAGSGGGPAIGISVQIGSLAAVSSPQDLQPAVEQQVIEGTVEGKAVQVGSVRVGESNLLGVE